MGKLLFGVGGLFFGMLLTVIFLSYAGYLAVNNSSITLDIDMSKDQVQKIASIANKSEKKPVQISDEVTFVCGEGDAARCSLKLARKVINN